MIHGPSRPLVPAMAGLVVTLAVMTGCSPPAPEATPDPAATPAVEETPAAPSESPAATADAEAVVAAARESIAASISSGNTAALEGYLTDQVLVTIAASEYQESLVPGDAVAQVSYVIDLSATWNFALPESTIDAYRSGFYAPYFPADALVGLSSTGAVIAFSMNGAEATAIFMCIDEALLF